MRPQSNGLVEFHDNKDDDRGFYCIELVKFIDTEAKMGTERYQELWEERFTAAKLGSCEYRDRCPIYERTIARVGKQPVQLTLLNNKAF